MSTLSPPTRSLTIESDPLVCIAGISDKWPSNLDLCNRSQELFELQYRFQNNLLAPENFFRTESAIAVVDQSICYKRLRHFIAEEC
jgi:hypothetical protein